MEYYIGYDDIFKEIEINGEQYPKDKLLNFIKELSINWSSQRDITDKQFKILKKSLNEVIEKDRERTLLENTIIINCPNYVVSNFSIDQYSSIYLEFIKDYFTCEEKLLLLEIKINGDNNTTTTTTTSNLDEEIIENDIGNSKLLNEINLLNSILLFKEMIGLEGYEKYRDNILNLINSLYEIIIPSDDEAERFAISIPFENLLFLIQLFENYPKREAFLNLLLKFVYFFECIQTTKYYQIKYHDQILEAINCEKVLFGGKESFSLIQPMVETLLKHARFDVFKLQGLLMSINRGSYNEYFKYIFSIVEFDIVIPIIQSQSSFSNVNPKNIIKEIIETRRMDQEFNNSSDNGNDSDNREVDRFYTSLQSFFKIENYYQGVNSKVEKKYLKKTYDEIFKQLSESRLLEASLEALFYKLDEFPIKLKFIKKQLNFILSQLELHSIQRVICKVECLKKELNENTIYKEKVKEFQRKINDYSNNNNVEIESLESMPAEIIQHIIHFLIDSPTMNSYRKLEISLINRDFFRMVQSIMNKSILNPIELNSNYFFHHGTGGIYSLFQQKQASFIKYQAKANYISDPDGVDTNLYSLTVIDSFAEWGHIITYTNESKLQALDFQGELDQSHLDYLKSNKTIQKLIIRTTSTNANQLHEQIKEMILEKQLVQLHLFIDIKEEEPNINYRINFDLVDSVTVSIGQFFDKDFYQDCIPKVKSLTLVIEKYDPFNELDFGQPILIDSFIESNQHKLLELSNLQELNLHFTTSDSSFEYFDNFIKLFSNATNLKSISFKNPGGGNHCKKSKKVISNILKSSSQYHQSIQFIKIFKSSNITMYEDINEEKDWYNIPTYKFLPEPNFIVFNKKQQQVNNNDNNNNIDSNKRKFEEI